MTDEASIEILSTGATVTHRMGTVVGKAALPGDVIALSGELGCGKTCFTGGIAEGLGVERTFAITSPTFTLINEYPAKCRLYHMDVYRLGGAADLDDLGFDDILASEGVVVIEWADRISGALPQDAMHVHFEYIDETRRKISLRGDKKRIQELAKAIKTEVE